MEGWREGRREAREEEERVREEKEVGLKSC